MRPKTSRSRSVSSASGSTRRRRPTRRENRRIDHGLAFRDSAERVDEDRDGVDTLLQQVADPLGVLLEQPHRVARLDVLREDEHPDLPDERFGAEVEAALYMAVREAIEDAARRGSCAHFGPRALPRPTGLLTRVQNPWMLEQDK